MLRYARSRFALRATHLNHVQSSGDGLSGEVRVRVDGREDGRDAAVVSDLLGGGRVVCEVLEAGSAAVEHVFVAGMELEDVSYDGGGVAVDRDLDVLAPLGGGWAQDFGDAFDGVARVTKWGVHTQGLEQGGGG